MEPAPLDPFRPIWLWPEAAGLRLWTPDETHHYPSLAMEHPMALRRATRDGRTQIRLDKVLRPLALAEDLARLLLAPGPRPRVHLANGPDFILPLQEVPFESLWLDGHPLAALATFCRHVRLDSAPSAPAPERELIIADLWPRPTPASQRPLAGLHAPLSQAASTRILPGPRLAEAFLGGTDPANYAALTLFCHGAERDDPVVSPFLGPDGRPWDLPLHNGLPPLVILLACGSDTGNLIHYGRKLLAHGARTLIAPFGRLDARAARDFLVQFLPRWSTGWRADTALQAAQARDETGWGARRLVLIGVPGLRRANRPLITELSSFALAELARHDPDLAPRAVTHLAELCTLDCFQRGANPAHAKQTLDDLLATGPDHEAGERWLFETLDNALSQHPVGRLTQAWLYPWLAQGAEQYHHERMAYYESAWRNLGEITDWAPPGVHHYWFRTAYRRGRYGEAFAALVKGLAAWPEDEFGGEGLSLGRDLANLLIEFDVPKAAVGVASALRTKLTALRPTTAMRAESHKLLDTLARAYVRCGGDGWRAALALLQRKRSDAYRHFGQDGQRELAGLLHILSWVDPVSRQAAETAAKVRAILADTADSLARIRLHPGNSTDLYLLRALAAWTWRTRQAQDLALILPFQDLWQEDLFTRLDPGPIGYLCAYLSLYHQTTGQPLPPGILSWSAARELLIGERYFLEVALFDALLGRRDEALALLGHFQNQGATLNDQLRSFSSQPNRLSSLDLPQGKLDEWQEEMVHRYRDQQILLATEGGVNISAMVFRGFIPL